MDRRRVLGMIGSAATVLQAASAPRTRFIGVWKLISAERKLKDGRIDYPYGEKPVGRITYDKAGRMSAQLMRPGRRSTLAAGMSFVSGNASAEEIREAVAGFAAYFGRFDVDEASKTVTHHVEACLIPSYAGTDLKRTYRFFSNRLQLSADSPLGVLDLVWEREPD